ncbi:MAG: segregation/condensation protein A [Bacteroidota bacterium]
MNTTEDNFEIKLPQFEGPFDLLLFFIERDELDIQNIPIAQITNDFLNYIHHLQTMNIEVASEFILVASTLMSIKAKMLLPRYEAGLEDGNDPRKDLIEQLIAYKRFKTASEEFRLLENERMLKFARGNIKKELDMVAANSPFADELNSLTLFKLLTTFEKVMERLKVVNEKPMHNVVQYLYTIEGQRDHIIELVKKHDKVSFVDILMESKDRIQAIFSFLATLELLQERIVTLILGTGFNNFWLAANKT